MRNKSEQPCPCTSGKTYAACCQRFHRGDLPATALELMRSRFSAYAFNEPDYIIKTTHPSNPHYTEDKYFWRRDISKFSKGTSFNKLEILGFKEQLTVATVTFTAHIAQKGRESTFTEKSYFEKLGSHWLYRGGHVISGEAPNLMTMDELRLLPLAYYGDPILIKKAEPVAEINDDLRTLVDDMMGTMDICNGMGLAAPQVHHSLRLFIIQQPIENAEGKLESGEIKVFVNPTIYSPSEEQWTVSEGCLSIPGLDGDVPRPREISIDYTNLKGEKITERLKGWEARVVMHEYDHIEGVLFIDRISKEERASMIPYLEKLKKRLEDYTKNL